MEISQSRSLDVIEIDGASNRGIDEIRMLRENVKFYPTIGKFKIYIIDEVHMLTQEAFNALLKTLEEPPEFVKFIFATTQSQKVLPTILSRCQRLDFRRISTMETIAQLEKIVTTEKIEIDREVLFAIAKSSDGSLRDAESLLDQLVSFSKNRISLKDVISALGIVEQEALFEITDKIIQKDAKATLGLFNKIIDGGKDLSVFLTNLLEHFRNLVIAKVAQADCRLIDLPQEICQRLSEQAQNFSLEEIFSCFNILVNTQEIAKRLESLRIPLEISLVKLAHDKRGKNLNVLPPKETTLIAPSKDIDPVTFKAEPKDTTFLGSMSMDNVKDAWQNVIDELRGIKMSVATYLSEGSPIKLESNILTISFPKNLSLHKESLERKENKTIVENAVSKLLNSSIKVNFILSKDITKNQDESADDSIVKSAVAAFKARVIKEN